MKVLDTIANLFWDSPKKSIDADKNSQEIISRTLNYGTLRDWRWLQAQYGVGAIMARVKSPERTGIRVEAKRLAEVLFSQELQ